MGAPIDFALQAYLNENCEIIVQDVTPEYIAPKTRDDYGIAIFTKPSFPAGSDYSCDLSNSYTWTLPQPPPGSVTLSLIGFWVENWVTGNNFSQGCITFYQGNFYIALHNLTPSVYNPGVDSGNWSPIDCSDPNTSFSQFMVALGICSNIDSSDTQRISVECIPITLTKTDCQTYELCNNGLDNITYGLEDYRNPGTYLIPSDQTTFPIVLPGECASIPLTEDGVYVLRVDVGEVQKCFVLYEYCTIKNCLTSLIDSILCNEWDPCCSTCDKETLEIMKRKRETLNMMIALMGELLSYINMEYAYSLGMFDIDDAREQYISRVAELIAKLKVIVLRCGECSDSSSEDTPCLNCGQS
jgi:hypothetical protein